MKLHVIALSVFVFALAVGTIAPAGAQAPQPAAATTIYLPSLSSGFGPLTVFGVEVTRLDPSRGLDALAALRPGWVRLNGLRWSEIEPVAGAGYRWDSPATRALEADMARAAERGLNLILIVHRSPSWALPVGSGSCGPILPEQRATFARFIKAAAARYSKPPYYVRHWEIGNEPDAPQVSGNLSYGCWGDADDPYYGGRAYGELLKVAYPAIKAADPQAQVLNGGLLLDQPYDQARSATLGGRFFEGMLEAGAGSAFDMLAYHSYSHYDGDPDGNVGARDWKPAYLRELLRLYGLSKPLINTESALLCHDVSAACTQAQAYAVPRLYTRALRDELRGLVWFIFDSDGFRNTALVEPRFPSTTRPAHTAYVQVRAALAGLRFAGAVSGLPAGAEGYRFTDGRRTTLLIWSNVPTAARVSLGAAAGLSCAEWDGSPLACAASAGALSLEARPGVRYISYRAP